MATQVQWRGGSTAEHATFTGAAREVTVDTQKKTLVVHDGSTAGGEPLLREDQNNLPSSVTNGLYTPGTNQVALSTNGDGRLFVDASGNVGVGLATPAPVSSYRVLHLRGGTTTNGGMITLDSSDGSKVGRLYAGSQVILDNSASSTDIYLKTNTANSILFGTNNTERLRITSTGQLSFIGAGSSGSPAVGFNGSAPSNSLVIDSSGRLLVGTSSAATVGNAQVARLAIQAYPGSESTGQAVFSLQSGRAPSSIIAGHRLGEIGFNANNGAPFAEIVGEADGTAGTNDYPGRLVFSTNGGAPDTSPTERMRIKSNGIINFSNAPVYADNTAATAGGLVAGDVYRTATGQLMITY